MKIHKNEKKFICDKCYKKFTTTTNLKQHAQIHAESKEERKMYTCEYEGCDKKYLYMCNLKKHAKDHTDPLGNIIGDNNPQEWCYSLSVGCCKIKLVLDLESPNSGNRDHAESKITYKELSGTINYNPDELKTDPCELDEKVEELMVKAKGAVSASVELHPSLDSVMSKIVERLIAYHPIIGSKSLMIKIKEYGQFVDIVSFLLKNYGPNQEFKGEETP